MRTPPDKRIIWTFHSYPAAEIRMRWVAKVTFEPGSTDASDAPVEVVDGHGQPVADATFEFAGVRIPIVAGRGALRCADFIKGKHEPTIWLHRPACDAIPGALTFA